VTSPESPDQTSRLPGVTRAARAGFAVYAIALVVATHWPNLRIEGPIERPDLYLHAGAFGLWTLLLIACSFFGQTLGSRNVLACALVGSAFASLDELSQSIPILNRVSAVDDAVSNLVGVILAAIGCLVLGAALRR